MLHKNWDNNNFTQEVCTIYCKIWISHMHDLDCLNCQLSHLLAQHYVTILYDLRWTETAPGTFMSHDKIEQYSKIAA